MTDENLFADSNEFTEPTEELELEFDGSLDPEAVWEWDGQAWIAVGG